MRSPTGLWLAGCVAVIMAASACGRERPAETSTEGPPVPTPRGEFVARTHPAKTGAMPYRLFTPKGYDPQRRYPLILWLHGGGGSGNDNQGQIAGDQIPGTHTWATPENQAAHPAFVLVPQTASGWAGADMPDLGPNLAAVIEILDAVTAEFSIDSRRIYAAGSVDWRPRRLESGVQQARSVCRSRDAVPGAW